MPDLPVTFPEHVCHALRCHEPCDPVELMCPPHWAKVPSGLQQAVIVLYRPGQEIDKRPSPAYLVAACDAVDAVAVLDGILAASELPARHARMERDAPRLAGLLPRLVQADRGE